MVDKVSSAVTLDLTIWKKLLFPLRFYIIEVFLHMIGMDNSIKFKVIFLSLSTHYITVVGE